MEVFQSPNWSLRDSGGGVDPPERHKTHKCVLAATARSSTHGDEVFMPPAGYVPDAFEVAAHERSAIIEELQAAIHRKV